MGRPTTEAHGNVRRLLRWMFVVRPPSKPPGRIGVALVLLAFVVWCSSTALSWGTSPPLLTLALFCGLLAAVLSVLGGLASYHRWRGDLPGELLRLASGLSSVGFLVLLLAHMVLMGLRTGQWGWVWWALFGLALTIAVGVAGRSYGPQDGPHPENGSPEERSPSN